MNKNIIVNADNLNQHEIKQKYVIENVNSNLYKINNTIEYAIQNNKNQIIYNLPTIFDIPNMFIQDEFKIEVYYNIINILEAKNYKIKIRLLQNDTILNIRWGNMNDNELNNMKDKISSITY